MLKRILSGITAAAVTVSCLVCGTALVSAGASDVYSENFSNSAFVAGSRIAGVENGAVITPPAVNGGTWKWASTNTNPTAATNKAVFTAEAEDDGNKAAKYENTVQRVSSSSDTSISGIREERYGVVFDNALEGDVTISFKLKKSSGTPQIYIYVGDDGTANSTAFPLTKTTGGRDTWGAPLFKLIQDGSMVRGAYYPAKANGAGIFRTDTIPESNRGETNAEKSHVLSDSAWSTYSISINTYTGKTAFSCDTIKQELDACEGGKGAKIGSFCFYIDRNCVPSAFLIDDITVSQNSIEKLSFAEVTGESGDTVSGASLPTVFSGLGADWTVEWSGEGVAENGAVTHGKEDKVTSLTATFISGDETVGTKTFNDITIAAFNPLAQIDFEAIRNANTERGAITTDLKLPVTITEGDVNYSIEWSSSDPDVISNNGKVVRTAFDAPVLLTAEYEGAQKSILLNVAAERTDMYFNEYMTDAQIPSTFTKWNASTSDTWTTVDAASTNLEIPSVAADPKDSENSVLELKKIATRNDSVTGLGVQSGLYRKVENDTSAADVQYVSLDILPTESTPRTEIRVINADGKITGGICYMIKDSSAPYLNAFDGSNAAAFADNNAANNVLTVGEWSNITMKLDYAGGYLETYLNGKYVGKCNLRNSDNKNIGYIYLGMERNEKNPVTKEAFTAENCGLVYFDNITVRTAASDANGAYGLVSYENGTLKLRKIVNTDNDTMLIAAAYSGGKLADTKVSALGSGKDCPSIITIENFGVSGDSVKIFNWETESLKPIGNGVVLTD